MKKTQIIKEIVGRKLEPFGFRYYKTEGPLRIFIREVHGRQRFYDPENDVVKQYISIQESNFAKELTVWLYTDAYGHEGGRQLEQLKEFEEQESLVWVEYTDENSYRKILNDLVEIIIKYGFEVLEEMSKEDPIIPTKDMTAKLYKQHEKLDKLFTEEYHVKVTPKKEDDIDEWYKLIYKIIMESVECSYEEVKERLIKIAAFIGERSCELLAGEWDFPSHFKEPSVYSTYPIPQCFRPLSFVVMLWKNKCGEEYWSLVNCDIEIFKQAVNRKSKL